MEKSFRIDLSSFMTLILKLDFITSRGRSNSDSSSSSSSSSRGNSISTEVVGWCSCSGISSCSYSSSSRK